MLGVASCMHYVTQVIQFIIILCPHWFPDIVVYHNLREGNPHLQSDLHLQRPQCSTCRNPHSRRGTETHKGCHVQACRRTRYTPPRLKHHRRAEPGAEVLSTVRFLERLHFVNVKLSENFVKGLGKVGFSGAHIKNKRPSHID